MSNKITKTQSNRLPAPALFVGPPSRNASNTSLMLPGAESGKPSRTPLTRQRSLLSQDPSKRPLPPTTSQYDGDHLSLTSSNPSAPFIRRQKQQHQAADAEASSRAEAIWAEMQNTLEEVELSAIKGPGMTVFGSEHSRALDELRKAQIDLAKAWARSEAEESEQSSTERKTAETTTSPASILPTTTQIEKLDSNTSMSASALGGTLERSKLEEETEKDIELSRKRREANDRYFEKVNKGVLEVVVKLEEVAKAMKGVEVESNEIWRENDGESTVDTASVTTAHSVT